MRSRIRSVAFAALAFVFYSCSESSITGPDFDTVQTRAAAVAVPSVVISQVYGGGGNAGAQFKNDFMELFNPGTAAVSVAGWSVQYASAAGTTWAVTNLSGSIPAGGYYLVQQAAGAGAGVFNPSPDATGNTAMSATAGKVWLASSTAALSGTCPTGGSVVDQVSFGTTATTCNSFGTTPNLTNTTAALRKDAGCTYTANLAADFATGVPAPRNTSSLTKTCVGPPPEQPVVDHVSVTGTKSSILVGETSQFTAVAYDAGNVVIPGTSFTWSSSNSTAATVAANGLATGKAAGDALIIATTANGKSGSATLHVDLPPPPPPLPNIRFSEIHYDNFDVDTGEKIEIEGPANTNLTGWSIVLYNGNGGVVYGLPSVVLSATIQESCTGRGVVVVSYSTDGIQNGAPDGFALIDAGNNVVEFLSYEGSLTAVDGPAAGRASIDIIAKEDPAPAAGNSLQRKPDGSWEGPKAHSFGVCNGTGGTPPASTNQISFSGRVPGDPALPVGFEDQLFGTERDGATNAIISTTFTWTSETPSIASIDAFGVMHALSGGSATFRATAIDGTTATYTLPTIALSPGSSAQYGNNTEFGVPTDSNPADDYLITRPEFTVSFSSARNTANWVAYNLDASHIAGAVDRCDCFTHDPQLPASFTHISTADYTGAGAFAGYGIDRGHLARSFDRTAAAYDNAQTYLFSNIIPQAAVVNQGNWAQLENFLGAQATASNKEVYIIAGVAGNLGTVKNENKLVIPAQVWKVAVIMPRNQGLADVRSTSDLQVLAWIAQNTPAGNTDWHTWETTVDAVEALSGYDLLALLPNNIEAVVEGTTKAPISEPGGPYTAAEGSPVAFNGSASSDPDGDALSYAWQFGDGSNGTGVTAEHVYADNGGYTAILTATDPAGAFDVTDTPVTITNAVPVVNGGSDIVTNSGQQFTLSASFSDAGANDSPWSYSINWGDGSSSTGTAGTQGGFSSTHTYATAGNFSVSVKVTDKDGGIGSDDLSAISHAAPTAALDGPYTSSEGSAVTMSAAGSSDADGTIAGYAWDFGDGTTATGAAVSHTYAQDGDYTVTLVVTDNDGLTGTTTTSAHAANVGPVLTKGLGVVMQSNGSYSATGSFTDPGADAWTATVDYGDGSGVSPLALNGKAFALSHQYAAGHTYTITIALSDDDASDTDSYSVRVLAEPVSNAGGAYSSNEGSPVSMSGAGSSDIDGSITSYAWSFGDGSNATGSSVAHSYSQDGDYTVTLVVTDNDGLTGTSTTIVHVSNVGASIGTFAGATLLPGEAYSASGSFTDPGLDTWTSTVNYGDGSGTSALALVGKSFSLAHTYTTAGTFTVTVTVNDGAIASTRTTTVTVQTAVQGVQNASAIVSQFVAAGKLSNGNGNSLTAKLNAAQNQISNGNLTPALNQLQAVLNEINALVNSGKLSTADANALREAVNRVIASIS